MIVHRNDLRPRIAGLLAKLTGHTLVEETSQDEAEYVEVPEEEAVAEQPETPESVDTAADGEDKKQD